MEVEVPPPRLRESNFKLRQRRQERMQPQQGLEFWDRWLHEARTILDQGAMWFGASPPGPPGLPSFVPVQEGEQGIRLKWSPPLPKIEAPVEGYVLQVKDVSAQPSDSALASTFAVDVWHDALSLLFCKDEPTCTWSTHTEWQLGLRKEDGSNEEVLLPGRKYTFRVLAVNRMGASKPSEELAQAIELSSTPSSSSRKLKTTRPETRDRLSTLLPLELWHFSLLFSQVKAKVAGDEGVIKQFGSLCDSHGLFAHSNKLGFAYLWGLLTGRYRPWENFGVDVDARCPEAGGSSLGVLHGVVAWIGVPSDVSEETIARALEGKDRKLLELTLVDTQASVELKTWRGRFRTKSEAEAAVVEQPQLACITSSSTGLPQKMPKLVHGHRLEQLRGMGHDFSEPDFNSVPKHEWFDEPLMEAFETPERWTSSIPRENLTAVKLIVQGLLISMTGGAKQAQPAFHGGLYALLTAVTCALQRQPGAHPRLKQLPLFPTARNRTPLASSALGLRTDRGQGFSFFKHAFQVCRDSLCDLAFPKSLQTRDGSVDVEHISSRWRENLEGVRLKESVNATLRRVDLRSLRPTVSDSNQSVIVLPTLDGSAQVAALLALPGISVSNTVEDLRREVTTPLWVLMDKYTEKVTKEKCSQVRSFELGDFGHMEQIEVAREFLDRMGKDLQDAKTDALNYTEVVQLKGLDAGGLLTLTLAADYLCRTPQAEPLASVKLGEAYGAAKREADGDLPKMVKSLEMSFPHHQMATASASVLEASSGVLMNVYTRLCVLSKQLRDLIASETIEVEKQIEDVRAKVAPPSSERAEEDGRRRLQLRQLAGLTLRPQFEMLAFSQLSLQQEQDLSLVDQQLRKMHPHIRTRVALCQLRCTRMRTLGIVAEQTHGAVSDLLKLTASMLKALFAVETRGAPAGEIQPSDEMLRAVVQRTDCHLERALGLLKADMQRLLGEPEADQPGADRVSIQQQLQDAGFSQAEALRAAYLIAHRVEFDLSRVDCEVADGSDESCDGGGTLVQAKHRGERLFVLRGGSTHEPEKLTALDLREALRCADRKMRWRGKRVELPPPTLLVAETSAKPHSSLTLEVGLFGNKCESLAKALRIKRNFISETGDVRFDPRILAFEFAGRFMLRPQQSTLIRELQESAVHGISRCQQMIMCAAESSAVRSKIGISPSVCSNPCLAGAAASRPPSPHCSRCFWSTARHSSCSSCPSSCWT